VVSGHVVAESSSVAQLCPEAIRVGVSIATSAVEKVWVLEHIGEVELTFKLLRLVVALGDVVAVEHGSITDLRTT
jgi:hypothetical protein